ncbi:MAG: flavin reductase family protein [Candidatus Bipolaricaulota bacterium]|nr:flavin reductase family protein [Candidatus Bipolaricaulota bacterium]MDW8031119.1 flavin reductase family protein [Candidatus Bipolaricaulota bacterium]
MATVVSVSGAGQFLHHYPKLATVVTVKAEGRENALAIAWHCALSFNPPLYGVAISPKRFSYELILESKEFAINFLPIESVKLIAAVGRTSGREFNKFERFQIATAKPMKISAPILGDAYAAYECKLVAHHTYGDHEWFVGEVVATHYLKEAFDAHEVLNVEKIKPAFYLGNDLYAELGKIAVHHLGREDVKY